jgi:hypothetical protein
MGTASAPTETFNQSLNKIASKEEVAINWSKSQQLAP